MVTGLAPTPYDGSSRPPRNSATCPTRWPGRSRGPDPATHLRHAGHRQPGLRLDGAPDTGGDQTAGIPAAAALHGCRREGRTGRGAQPRRPHQRRADHLPDPGHRGASGRADHGVGTRRRDRFTAAGGTRRQRAGGLGVRSGAGGAPSGGSRPAQDRLRQRPRRHRARRQPRRRLPHRARGGGTRGERGAHRHDRLLRGGGRRGGTPPARRRPRHRQRLLRQRPAGAGRGARRAGPGPAHPRGPRGRRDGRQRAGPRRPPRADERRPRLRRTRAARRPDAGRPAGGRRARDRFGGRCGGRAGDRRTPAGGPRLHRGAGAASADAGTRGDRAARCVPAGPGHSGARTGAPPTAARERTPDASTACAGSTI